jgi:type I restriction enzyme, S subunit
MKDDSRTLVPKLRFPEFRDTQKWTAGQASDLVRVLQGYGFPETHQGRRDGEYPFYKVSDISNSLEGGNHLITTAANYVDRDTVDELRANLIPEGTTIFAKIGEAIRSNRRVITTRPSLIDNNVAGLKAIAGRASDSFVYYLWSTTPLDKYAGGVVPAISKSAIEAIPVAYPLLPEQQKIADCLTSLDALLAAHGRKLEALRTHKNGLTQELFPREGENLPRLRFPQFRNAPKWTARELGSMTIKIGSGITPTGGSATYKTSGRPFIRSQNVGWGELILDDVAFIDERTHASFDGTELRSLDVLLNITGASIGRSAVADERVVGGNVNQHVCVIRTISADLNPVLLNQFLISECGQKQIDSFQAGGNRQGLNFGQIRAFQIPLPPSESEQNRVADFLMAIDALIAAQARRLDTLKTHKKGLMQQLFPPPEENL